MGKRKTFPVSKNKVKSSLSPRRTSLNLQCLKKNLVKDRQTNELLQDAKKNLSVGLDGKRKRIMEKCLSRQANVVIKPLKTEDKVRSNLMAGVPSKRISNVSTVQESLYRTNSSNKSKNVSNEKGSSPGKTVSKSPNQKHLNSSLVKNEGKIMRVCIKSPENLRKPPPKKTSTSQKNNLQSPVKKELKIVIDRKAGDTSLKKFLLKNKSAKETLSVTSPKNRMKVTKINLEQLGNIVSNKENFNSDKFETEKMEKTEVGSGCPVKGSKLCLLSPKHKMKTPESKKQICKASTHTPVDKKLSSYLPKNQIKISEKEKSPILIYENHTKPAQKADVKQSTKKKEVMFNLERKNVSKKLILPALKVTAKQLSSENEDLCMGSLSPTQKNVSQLRPLPFQPLIKLTRCDTKEQSNFSKLPIKKTLSKLNNEGIQKTEKDLHSKVRYGKQTEIKKMKKGLKSNLKSNEGVKMKFKLRIQFKNNELRDNRNQPQAIVGLDGSNKSIKTIAKIIGQDNKKSIGGQNKKTSKSVADSKNPLKKTFKCKMGCNETFKNLKNRRLHMQNDHKELIQCTVNECNVMLKPQNVANHIKTAHPRPKVKCSSCNEEIGSLKVHRKLCKNYVEKRPFACEEKGCYIRFETDSARKAHVSKCHTPLGPCPYKFCLTLVKPVELLGHLKTVHILDTYKCKKCSKSMLGQDVHSHLQDLDCVKNSQRKRCL